MIKKIITYGIVVVVALFALRSLLYKGIRKNKHGLFEKYNTMFLKSNNYNVLFLGSSRTETHFDTRIFDSITKLNSFNLGVTGATPRIAYGVLKAYCSKSELPEYLVYDLDFHFLKYGVDTIRHFPRYFPYLENDMLCKQFASIDNRFNQFRYNPVYSLAFSNIRLLAASLHGWLNIEGKYDTTYYKGFTKVCFTDTLKRLLNRPFYGFIHPVERNYIDSIIMFSKQNHIKLLLLTSPMYEAVNTEMLNKKQIVNQLKSIANSNNLPYYDLSNQFFSARKRYFTDYYHMTGQGAAIFSRDFGRNFQQYFDKNTVN